MKEELEALAKRCEEATGKMREIDSAIGLAIGLPTRDRTGEPGWSGRYFVGVLPSYTASIEAAISLVPEGMQWSFDSHYKMAGVSRYWDDPQHGPTCEEFAGEAANPALAICAAALRARA